MNIRQSLSTIFNDRGFFVLWLLMLVMVVVVIVIGAIYIRPSDLQVPVRYSSFGITNFYREKWYYLLGFMVFALMMAVFHTGISLRLLAAKGRPFAIVFLWLTITLLAVTAVTFLALFRVVSLSQ